MVLRGQKATYAATNFVLLGMILSSARSVIKGKPRDSQPQQPPCEDKLEEYFQNDWNSSSEILPRDHLQAMLIKHGVEQLTKFRITNVL